MQSNVLFAKSFLTVSIVSVYFGLASLLKDFVIGPKVLLQRTAFIYGCMGVCFGALHVVINDAVHCVCERRIDAKAASISEEYAKGGIEFYQKLIHRNQAARELSKEAEKSYTVGGNEKVRLLREKI